MRKLATIAAALAVAAIMVPLQGAAFEKDSLVVEKCTECHEADKDKTAKISSIRTTPEEWAVIVDRMHRLYGMELKDGEMAQLLKELCATQILTPEEDAKVSYMALFNNPQNIESPGSEEEGPLFAACVRCHSAGKIFSYRMTGDQWGKLRDFHLYIDPAIMFQMREMHWRDEADKVLAYLGGKYAYGKAWSAPTESPEGEWFILGDEPGKGTYRGSVKLASQGKDDYTVKGSVTYSDGTSEQFAGDATLYGGYALRTRTRSNGRQTYGAFQFVNGTVSGWQHYTAPDFRTSSATWYRKGGKAAALRVSPGYLLSGETTTVVVEGMQLPKVEAGKVKISGGVEVLHAKRLNDNAIEATVIYNGQANATGTVSVDGMEAGSITLAPRIDYITVTPGTGRARVSGGKYYPAEGVQFVAMAHSNGANVWDPADDVVLGPVEAAFHLEENVTRPGDDDLEWTGAIADSGKYLPGGDYGPLPVREYGGEGTGLVTVVANYARMGSSYSATARLAVVPPDFIQRIK